MSDSSKAVACCRPARHRWCLPGLALALVWLCLPAQAGDSVSTPSFLGERLAYRVSYRGALSGQNAVEIADAVLETKAASQAVDGVPAYYTALQASTADYPVLEGVYPFRYRFRSYYSTDFSRALYIDVQKISRKDQHERVRFDWEKGRAERYKRRGKATGLNASDTVDIVVGREARQQGWRNAKDKLRLDGVLLDRLSMLQAVRVRDLHTGQSMELSVSDGKTIYRYRIKVQGRELLQQDGQAWDTYKLAFDGFEQDEQGASSGTSDHAPVFVWLTADSHRLPVRFSSEALLGNFEIVVQTINGRPAMAPAGNQLASIP